MKILITGSSGFIGFHLAKLLLENKHKVHGYDSMNNYYDVNLKKSRLDILKKYNNFSFTKGNIENEKKLKKIGIQIKFLMIIILSLIRKKILSLFQRFGHILQMILSLLKIKLIMLFLFKVFII